MSTNTMRTDFSPGDMTAREYYKFLTSVVIPRPIALVSSTSEAGVDNVAPHSFFTIASTDPPIVQFTAQGRKDTLTNIEATGAFVVNFAPEALLRQINASGTDFPASISEFDAVGLTRESSLTVAAPRVADSPVALECSLHQIIPVGNSWLVLGRVTHAVVAAGILDGQHPRAEKLKPLARLGRNQWGTLGPVLAINRIPFDDWHVD